MYTILADGKFAWSLAGQTVFRIGQYHIVDKADIPLEGGYKGDGALEGHGGRGGCAAGRGRTGYWGGKEGAREGFEGEGIGNGYIVYTEPGGLEDADGVSDEDRDGLG